MLKQVNDKLKSARNLMAIVIALITLGGFGGMLIMQERDSDAQARSIQSLELKVGRLIDEVHAYEIALGEMKHACNLANMQYSYCKKSVK